MKALVLAFSVVLAGSIIAEEADKAEVVWLTDFDAAKKEATERGVPILINFSGSDWCGWCKKLEDEVLSKEEFAAYARNNFVLFNADFPRRKEQNAQVKAQNEKLMEKFGVRGFPTVLVVSAKGTVLARTGYKSGGPTTYIKHLKEEMK